MIKQTESNIYCRSAHLIGFTAWSSMRDPIAVFHLLETLYNAFDAIAARRGVFKVETVGDVSLLDTVDSF
jgi:class 3 adenylate cyclase